MTESLKGSFSMAVLLNVHQRQGQERDSVDIRQGQIPGSPAGTRSSGFRDVTPDLRWCKAEQNLTNPI